MNFTEVGIVLEDFSLELVKSRRGCMACCKAGNVLPRLRLGSGIVKGLVNGVCSFKI